MPARLTVTDAESLAGLERQVRALLAREGEVWVFADATRLRKLRRLAARFKHEQQGGGDYAFFGPMPQPPRSGGRPGETVADAGGLMVVSASPFRVNPD